MTKPIVLFYDTLYIILKSCFRPYTGQFIPEFENPLSTNITIDIVNDDRIQFTYTDQSITLKVGNNEFIYSQEIHTNTKDFRDKITQLYNQLPPENGHSFVTRPFYSSLNLVLQKSVWEHADVIQYADNKDSITFTYPYDLSTPGIDRSHLRPPINEYLSNYLKTGIYLVNRVYQSDTNSISIQIQSIIPTKTLKKQL